jgi:hypothetical protein
VVKLTACLFFNIEKNEKLKVREPVVKKKVRVKVEVGYGTHIQGRQVLGRQVLMFYAT